MNKRIANLADLNVVIDNSALKNGMHKYQPVPAVL